MEARARRRAGDRVDGTSAPVRRRRCATTAGLVCAVALAIAACGSAGGGSTASGQEPGAAAVTGPIQGGDWLQFNYDAQRSGVGPADTGITAGNVKSLKVRRVQLDGTVDSAPIELHAIQIGGRIRDLVVMTTTYGRTIAIDPQTGEKLWEFVPSDISSYVGSYQITNATPIADPQARA
jgi:glucose dehydrogenase